MPHLHCMCEKLLFYGNTYFQQGGTVLGQPSEIVDLGKTEIPFDVFMDFLHELSDTTYK